MKNLIPLLLVLPILIFGCGEDQKVKRNQSTATTEQPKVVFEKGKLAMDSRLQGFWKGEKTFDGMMGKSNGYIHVYGEELEFYSKPIADEIYLDKEDDVQLTIVNSKVSRFDSDSDTDYTVVSEYRTLKNYSYFEQFEVIEFVNKQPFYRLQQMAEYAQWTEDGREEQEVDEAYPENPVYSSYFKFEISEDGKSLELKVFDENMKPIQGPGYSGKYKKISRKSI